MSPIIRSMFCLICLAAAFLASAARGDGVYIPERAFAAMPTIPQQQAVIIHRNGTETLIVESAFQTKSPSVAWVLPLPAAPTSLQLAEPGAVTSTAYSLAPEITHDLHGLVLIPSAVCLAVIPFVLATILVRDPNRRWSVVTHIFIILFLFVLASAILLPSLGTASSPLASAATPGISILSSQRLGNADFTVLSAATSDDLDQWLVSQALRPLDAAAKSIVTQYIKDRWCFVVGHLQNNSTDLVIPRPLMATFPVAQPIFPMKITALANTTTHVELCIISDQQAAAGGFHCAVADRFDYRAAERENSQFPTQSDYYASSATRLALGHPDIVPLMWRNCVVTKLTADLAPAHMTQDIALSFVPLMPHRDAFFTDLSRRQIMLTVLATGTVPFLVLAAVILRGRRTPSPAQSRILFAALAGVFLVPLCLYLFLPTTAVRLENRAQRYLRRQQEHRLPQAALILANDGFIRSNMTVAEVSSLPQRMIDHGFLDPGFLNNPFTGQPLRPECSPGNFALRTIHDELYFCTYDQSGIESRLSIVPPRSK